MSFTPNTPTFNLMSNIWINPAVPSADAPAFTDIPCQLYIPSRGLIDITPGDNELWVPPIYIRMPTAQLVKWATGWIWEIPAGGSSFYKNRWKDFMHLGFPNQYLVVLAEQCKNDGSVPFFLAVTY